MTYASVSREEFQARKKRRIDLRKKEASESAPTAPKKKPTTSQPACHEIQGYMPGRMEFEAEWDNEAEMAVKDLFFEPGEGLNPITGQVEPEADLKLTVMDIYNGKLTQRAQRKRVMYEHNLLDYRKNSANEKKKLKEERELLNKAKPFARIMNKRDFDEFSEGLVNEQLLRQAISQLQEWRRMGIESLEAGPKYEMEKAQRVNAPVIDASYKKVANALSYRARLFGTNLLHWIAWLIDTPRRLRRLWKRRQLIHWWHQRPI